MNGRSITPWNPFLTDHESTWSSPIDRIPSPGGTVEVQCHVLPHKDRLGAKAHDAAAGPHGWTAQQGFYVYRNERLLVAGGWLGLGRRARLEPRGGPPPGANPAWTFPNTADSAWKIDIRKSTARPPVSRFASAWLTAWPKIRASERGACSPIAVAEPATRQQDPVDQAWRVEHSTAACVTGSTSRMRPWPLSWTRAGPCSR